MSQLYVRILNHIVQIREAIGGSTYLSATKWCDPKYETICSQVTSQDPLTSIGIVFL